MPLISGNSHETSGAGPTGKLRLVERSIYLGHPLGQIPHILELFSVQDLILTGFWNPEGTLDVEGGVKGKKHVNIGILQTVVAGSPLVMGLRTRI